MVNSFTGFFIGISLLWFEHHQFAEEVSGLRSDGIAHIEKVEEQEILVGGLERAKDKIAVGRVVSQVQVGNSDEIKNYIRSLWGDETERAFAIVYCESGWKTAVISRTGDVGLFQINLAAHWSKIEGTTRAEKIKALQDWKYNVDFAFKLWSEQGWRPWVCSRLKGYK